MLGGPQAGIIAGKARYVKALKQHPFFRALRCDKLILNTLQKTVEAYLHNKTDELPLHQCLNTNLKQLKRRATRLEKGLAKLPLAVNLAESQSQIGGGSLPQATLPSIALDLLPTEISLKDFAANLRQASTPVIGVICGGRFRLDLRTIFPEQEKPLLKSIVQALETS
jgi:L-seryl-tRNA(Ser) seleniumtransferase